MAGAHRSASPAAGRPTARILGALFAGSAVMFAATAVPNGAPPTTGGGAELIAGPRSNEPPMVPSPEVLVTPQGGAPSTAGDDAAPVIAFRSGWSVTRPSPRRAQAPEVAAAPDATAGQTGRWAPGTTADWETADWGTALRQALAQQASPQAAPAPRPSVPPAQNPPSAGNDNRSDNGVIEDLLGHLGAGR